MITNNEQDGLVISPVMGFPWLSAATHRDSYTGHSQEMGKLWSQKKVVPQL